MTLPRYWWLWLALVAAALQLLWREDAVETGPGIVAADPPVQTRPVRAEPFDLAGYRLTPLADFRIRARVLSRREYRFDREADLSPLDLALGWGRMSDADVLADIDITQSGRWYRWRAERLPIPRRELETHSTNVHLIPADAAIADTLDRIAQGQVVELTGRLVRVDAADGWRWISSLTRDDTGQGACELIYVERAIILL
jgi:hypothetical protein